jgi:CheY-like chemotaxis protein
VWEVHDQVGELGYQATAYHQSDGLFGLLRQLHPDLIVVDLWLEGPGSGWTLIDLLRTDEATAAIPLMLCSADLPQLQEREEWLSEHGVGILPKPFDLEELERLVSRLLATPATGVERSAS